MHTGRRITRLPDESLREGLKIAPLQLIIDTVLEHESASWDDVRQGTRRLPILMCRHMIHYLASISEERTFFEIAAIFQLDHATAMNSRNVVENLFETNHEFKLKLIKIATKIKIITMRQKVQIVGKVTGMPRIDCEAIFNDAEKILESFGYEVFNPVKMVPEDATYQDAMRICLKQVLEVDAVCILPNWTDSKGAQTEYMVANILQLKEIRL